MHGVLISIVRLGKARSALVRSTCEEDGGGLSVRCSKALDAALTIAYRAPLKKDPYKLGKVVTLDSYGS